ncbi:MAG: hypothetical protein QNJ61_09825 [Desulfobacterales bacterium]|nr:hypothetical protein [Desulfobacterales bacterium]
MAYTHRPLVIRAAGRLRLAFDAPENAEVADLTPGRRLILNCGSLGQPRDRQAAGSYLVLDTTAGRVEFICFGYDVHQAAGKIRAAGLPVYFVERRLQGK